ncbi:response regulator transcription factor [Paenibacillus larvae]|uniref:Two component transcriptional regulator, AraC family n=2 Tax=Paenibacillus larvae TaxID=1464 RepID=A0A6C0QWK2_9BACL|nr:response regulator transcription factor [Paenibacillus larvae]AQR76327.1 DNA-binding response regulator [Paenibacillus larvae subsp. larvae]AVF22873.1 Two component transcriptional regulator, AraC family [Paenibacillus larvae subsp. larvae]AVG13393.1 Two component transcriptional regulator, AraC family [Paenibacillus larvae subsp. larvae DSM 25430]ETK26469.1 Two component transcriptional regulator, AraC family [Paenibacillus larvae subsp. larvae DSM 25719]MCY7476299.1 response regulator tra
MRSVFLVDDEPFILEGLQTIMEWEKLGLKVVGHDSNGEKAFAFLKDHPVDLLITDIRMPKMDGLELIKQMKLIHGKMKFIILSGHHDFNYLKQGMKLGIENYILKPINIEELESTLLKINEKWEEEMSLPYSRQEDRDILRLNILSRWVTNNISQEELNHRSQILRIPLDYDSYTVAVLRLLSDPDEELEEGHEYYGIVVKAYLVSREVVNSQESVICFYDSDYDLVLIFGGRKEADKEKERIHEILKDIQLEIWNRLRHHVGITVGSRQTAYTQVHNSYDEAKGLFHNWLVQPGYPVLDIDHLPASDSVQTMPAIDYDLFTNLIIDGHKQEVTLFIEETFQKLLSWEGRMRIDVHNVAIKLILIAKNIEKNADYSHLFSVLFRIHTFEQMRDFVDSILQEVIDHLAEEEQEVSPAVRQMLDRVQQSYSEEISLKTLSYSMDMHPNYLGQLFQKEMEMTFSEYVNTFRIEKAKHLLLQTELKTNEIAARVGYTDPTYFYRIFKKYVGVSPTELRKMYGVS